MIGMSASRIGVSADRARRRRSATARRCPIAEPERDEHHERRDLDGGQRVLHHAAQPESADVHERQRNDRRQRDERLAATRPAESSGSGTVSSGVASAAAGTKRPV